MLERAIHGEPQLAAESRQPTHHTLQGNVVRRRRWFKVVAVSTQHPQPPGRTPRLYLDIQDGVTEYHFGRTTTHYDHTLPQRTRAGRGCFDGFEVFKTQSDALAADFPDSSALLLAPRALLEILVGGFPKYCKCDLATAKSRHGCARFMQVTPVRLVAEGGQLAQLYDAHLAGELRE